MDLEQREGVWGVRERWSRKDLRLHMASPVTFDDRVCGVAKAKKGRLFCVDRSNGEDIWFSPPRYGDYAVLLVTPENLLAIRPEGRLDVLERTADTYAPLHEYEIARSEVCAHPAVLPAGVIVRSKKRLSRLNFAAPGN